MCQEVADRMEKFLPHVDSVEALGQPVNMERFCPTKPIHDELRQALILSARIKPTQECVIQQACDKLGIKLIRMGGRFGWNPQDSVAQAINAQWRAAVSPTSMTILDVTAG
jgi:hypothetical protein